MNLQAEREAMNNRIDIGEIEARFMSAAAAYAKRKGISYTAFR